MLEIFGKPVEHLYLDGSVIVRLCQFMEEATQTMLGRRQRPPPAACVRGAQDDKARRWPERASINEV